MEPILTKECIGFRGVVAAGFRCCAGVGDGGAAAVGLEVGEVGDGVGVAAAWRMAGVEAAERLAGEGICGREMHVEMQAWR